MFSLGLPMPPSHRSPPLSLPPLQTDEFLPPLQPWMRRGAWLLVGLLVSGVGMASMIPYTVTVPAIAQLRPVTGVTSVTVTTNGTLRRVLVQENQAVRQGEVLAEVGAIDPVQLQRLQSRLQRLQTYIQQYQTQLEQVTTQLQAFNQQIVTAAMVSPAGAVPPTPAVAVTDLEVQSALQRLSQTAAEQSKQWRLQRDRLQQQQTSLTRQIGYDQTTVQAIERELSQVVILAPTTGTLLKLNLGNLGQPLRAGEVVAQIVPTPINLVAKARVQVEDISQIAVGQAAQLRISAYPYPDYGVLAGTVQAIAPDATTESNPLTGVTTASYEVTIQLSQPYLLKGDRQYPLQSGMAARTDIITRQETLIQAWWRKLRLWTDV